MNGNKPLAWVICSKKPYRTLEDYALTLAGIPPLTTAAFKIRGENSELNRLYLSYLQTLEYAVGLGELKAAKVGLDSVCRFEDFQAWAEKTGYMEAPAVEDVSQSKGVYAARDKDFQAWIDTDKPDLSAMKKAEIQAELIKRNGALWRFGFADWWKYQDIYKSKPGRKPG